MAGRSAARSSSSVWTETSYSSYRLPDKGNSLLRLADAAGLGRRLCRRVTAFCLAALLVVAAATSSQAATLEEMAGQMILTGFQGEATDAESVRGVVRQIADGRIGGVMYLKNNVRSLEAVRAMNAQFAAASPALPPFIALDQEGGSIERLTAAVGFAEIPSAREVAEQMTPEAAQRVYMRLGRDLADLGFNLNFGPVADVDINPANPIIARYGRAFSDTAAQVADYAAAFVAGHRQAGVLTALKHFPGHGSSEADSHAGFVDITRTWRADELDPYRALLARGLADMVMVGHLFHRKFVVEAGAEPPASLSPSWITGVLRHQLHYDGVVISDDMEMSAIRSHFGFRNAIVRAVRAGTDILLFSNTADYRPGLADDVLDVLVQEAQRDPAFRARIEESYGRIVRLKQRLTAAAE